MPVVRTAVAWLVVTESIAFGDFLEVEKKSLFGGIHKKLFPWCLDNPLLSLERNQIAFWLFLDYKTDLSCVQCSEHTVLLPSHSLSLGQLSAYVVLRVVHVRKHLTLSVPLCIGSLPIYISRILESYFCYFIYLTSSL